MTFTVDVAAVDSPEMAENLDAQLVRRSLTADTRWRGATSWYLPNLSYWRIPDELVTDGVNNFEIEVRRSLLIHAAYVSSHPYVESDPDPDPGEGPDCPVAT